LNIHTENNRLKNFLEIQTRFFNKIDFIENDPISIPHMFKRKEDIEIAAFLTATISWGNRKSILSNARKMMALFDNDPYNFIVHHSDQDLKSLQKFVHRTFNSTDLFTFIFCLKKVYTTQGGLETLFSAQNSLEQSMVLFPEQFFSKDISDRSRKHVAKIAMGSSAKRLNMFLRWMVRKDDCGVDFGIWDSINASSLFIPLDVHSGNTARKLGLLQRTQNDWKAVVELTNVLRSFDKKDPVKYDYALFGIGVTGQSI
jgi:uncharacterized protein (TIGR02757 family)